MKQFRILPEIDPGSDYTYDMEDAKPYELNAFENKMPWHIRFRLYIKNFFIKPKRKRTRNKPDPRSFSHNRIDSSYPVIRKVLVNKNEDINRKITKTSLVWNILGKMARSIQSRCMVRNSISSSKNMVD